MPIHQDVSLTRWNPINCVGLLPSFRKLVIACILGVALGGIGSSLYPMPAELVTRVTVVTDPSMQLEVAENFRRVFINILESDPTVVVRQVTLVDEGHYIVSTVLGDSDAQLRDKVTVAVSEANRRLLARQSENKRSLEVELVRQQKMYRDIVVASEAIKKIGILGKRNPLVALVADAKSAVEQMQSKLRQKADDTVQLSTFETREKYTTPAFLILGLAFGLLICLLAHAVRISTPSIDKVSRC